jgi:SAM-dependent methyltransferase
VWRGQRKVQSIETVPGPLRLTVMVLDPCENKREEKGRWHEAYAWSWARTRFAGLRPSNRSFDMSEPAPLGSIAWNEKTFGNPEEWALNGDKWTFHAEFSGQPYEKWKQSLVIRFLDPYLGPDVDVLEVAPGYGRWTEFMVGHSRSLVLVDLVANSIDVCRERFGSHPEVSFIANDGRSLPVASESVDLIWSFGGFVHIDPKDVDSYLAEIRRVLRPGGRYVIHHSGWPEWSRRLVPVTRHLGRPGRILQRRLARSVGGTATWRVAMSPKLFASMAAKHDLCVDEQIRVWGEENEFGLAFGDMISLGSRRPRDVPARPCG